jgi:hypothetical protein
MIDTWTCHVCGDERPDARISVHKTVVTTSGVEITQNVRHCNDRPRCIEGAQHVDFLGGPASYVMEKRDRPE